MKENLKAVSKYFTYILYVALAVSILLVKVILDSMLYLSMAFVYAILNDHDNTSKVLNNVADKWD